MRQPDIYYGFRNDKIYADEQLAQFSPVMIYKISELDLLKGTLSGFRKVR
jgi:hypothetical protein